MSSWVHLSLPLLTPSLIVLMTKLLKSTLPSLEISYVLVSLEEFEISYGLCKLAWECKYMFIIGCHNNFRSENIPISCKHVFEKTLWRITQNNRPPRNVMLICDNHSALLSYVKNEPVTYITNSVINGTIVDFLYIYIHCLKGKLGLYILRQYCNIRNHLWIIYE